LNDYSFTSAPQLKRDPLGGCARRFRIKLTFLDRDYTHAPIRTFWDLLDHDVPEKRGAYVLLAASGTTFMYPRRQSSVFYIGQARNLRRRLLQHRRFAIVARDNRKEVLYWPRYEYAAAFGARYTFILAKPREKPKTLENELLAMFAEHYRSWPVANGTGGWGSLLTLAQLRRRQRSRLTSA